MQMLKIQCRCEVFQNKLLNLRWVFVCEKKGLETNKLRFAVWECQTV